MGGEEGDLPAQPRRVHAVVGVQAGHQGSAALGESGVERRNQPPVGQGEWPDARVLGRRAGQDRAGGILRAIVHGHQLPIRELLRAHRGDGLRDRGGGVVGGHQHADSRGLQISDVRLQIAGWLGAGGTVHARIVAEAGGAIKYKKTRGG